MSGFAGTLRQRVVIQRPSAIRDDWGGADEDWTIVDVVWARIGHAGRGAPYAGDAAATMPVWRATMRPCDVKVGDRIEWVHGTITVRETIADPGAPDRIVAIGEMLR
jgi:head-tail adaptor